MKTSTNSAKGPSSSIMSRLDELAKISEQADGLTRRYLSPEHRSANDLLGKWMATAGMSVREDAVGNIIGRYEGEQAGLPAIMVGSHLDTVLNAGRYDGMLGVVTGIDCVASLNRRRVRLPFAVEVIGFADEEGLRFHSTYLGSRAVAGTFDAGLLSRTDADDILMVDAMRGFGLDPDRIQQAAREPRDVIAYLELHIEQGPVLEDKGLAVGIVTAIAGATRLVISIEGLAGHAGTVPMKLRRDALAAASECVVAVEKVATQNSGTVGTVGQVTVSPGATNVIPGEVTFSVDFRSADDPVRMVALADLHERMCEIASRRNVVISAETVHEAPSVNCSINVMNKIERSIIDEGLFPFRLPSGAGHDAAAMADLTDIGMIFIRCKDGVSHHPAESTTEEDALTGARLLLNFLQNFNKQL